MTAKRLEVAPSPRTARVAIGAALGLALIVSSAALVGCNKEKAPAPEKPPAEAEPVATAESKPQSMFDEQQFAVKIVPAGDYKAGEEGKFNVELKAKAGFHCNEEYPYKFKTAAGEGVSYPKQTLDKGAMKLDKLVATMEVPFVPAAAGQHRVGGLFSFSVCSAERCLTEKRELVTMVDVK